MSGVDRPGYGNRTAGPGGRDGPPSQSLEDRSDTGGIGYGRTGSSCDRPDRKPQDVSLGRRREDLPDQHPPPLRCGSPGSDKVRACTTICCSVRQSSSTPPPLLPRKVRENQFLGTSSVLAHTGIVVVDLEAMWPRSPGRTSVPSLTATPPQASPYAGARLGKKRRCSRRRRSRTVPGEGRGRDARHPRPGRTAGAAREIEPRDRWNQDRTSAIMSHT